jgi:hypothetical protein
LLLPFRDNIFKDPLKHQTQAAQQYHSFTYHAMTKHEKRAAAVTRNVTAVFPT